VGTPPPCWTCARQRQRAACSGSKPSHRESSERRISRRVWKRSRAVPTHSTSVAIRSVVANRIRINILALGARLPTIYSSREYVEAGGLRSYGPKTVGLFPAAAPYVGEIPRGPETSEIPRAQTDPGDG